MDWKRNGWTGGELGGLEEIWVNWERDRVNSGEKGTGGVMGELGKKRVDRRTNGWTGEDMGVL